MTAEVLAKLEAACFPDAATRWSKAAFAAHLNKKDSITIAFATGYAIGRITMDEAELISIGVHPEARNRGVGSRLLEHFIETATQQGAKSIFLEVAETNAHAIALYAKFGFETVGTRRGYYKRPDGTQTDALIMSKRINP